MLYTSIKPLDAEYWSPEGQIHCFFKGTFGIVPEAILLLSQEPSDRNCCGGLDTAVLDCSLGNNDDQSLQRAVLCQQSGV